MSCRALILVALAAGCAMPRHQVQTAVSFERQAEAALAAGDQERALSLYQQAAEHWRGVGNHKIYAATLDSIARIHKNRGDFDLAVDAWQQALSVAKYAKDTDTVLRTLANLGMAHSAWGRYGDALRFYEESLALAETLKHDASIARIHNNIGTVYRYQGKLDEALARYEKALAIDRRLRDEAAIAARTANVGTVYMDRGDYEQARKHYETALAAARKLGDQDKIAVRLNNLGAASYSLGDYEGALTFYREALEIHNKLGQRHEAATVLSNMGSAYWYLERYGDAEQALVRSIGIKETLRKGATGDIRQDYLASQIDTYEWLTSTHVRAGAFEKALLAADSSRAKYLTDQLLSAGKESTVSDSTALTKAYLDQLGKDTAVVYFANVGWNRLLRFVATTDGVSATEIDTTTMLSRLAPGDGGVDPTTLKGNRDALANAIMAYRELLTSVAPSDDEERNRQARTLFDALLADDRALASRSHLIFVPDGSLAFLPFETLRTKKGYLIEDRLVTYAPSLAVAELIRHRKTPAGKNVLAVGGAVYDAKTEKSGEQSRGQIAWDAQKRQTRGLLLTETYADLGYGSFSDLPGTREEVNGIARIVPGTKVLLGESVTEARIKRLSREGDLAKYRMLHFATHGIALPETPSLSALVLSLTPKAMEGEDGFLTMAEIAKLRIDAEQVVLSACETGLGKLYAGEGVVGLTQAFFVAGARGVAVSLWEVADDSTSELMLSAYDTMQTKGRSFAQAMADAKRVLIKSRFSRPYYWAPFVHYGAWSAR